MTYLPSLRWHRGPSKQRARPDTAILTAGAGTLATLPEPPDSVPINALVPVEGTPLGERPPVAIWDMVRTIGTARIFMPRSMVRLSAGRLSLMLYGVSERITTRA